MQNYNNKIQDNNKLNNRHLQNYFHQKFTNRKIKNKSCWDYNKNSHIINKLNNKIINYNKISIILKINKRKYKCKIMNIYLFLIYY